MALATHVNTKSADVRMSAMLGVELLLFTGIYMTFRPHNDVNVPCSDVVLLLNLTQS